MCVCNSESYAVCNAGMVTRSRANVFPGGVGLGGLEGRGTRHGYGMGVLGGEVESCCRVV